MLNAFRNDDELAFAYDGFVIAEFHAQRASYDQKKFILNVMMVPDELTFQLDRLHGAIVDFTDDARVAVVGEATELFFEIDGFHFAPGLQIPHDLAYAGKNASRGIQLGGFGVDAQQIFRTGSAHHDPANFAKIDLDAIHIFAAGDRPVEKLFQVAICEMRDSFFFLAGLHIEIDATVMVFAKFGVQRAEQFTERLAVPSHQFGQKQRRYGGVALGKVQAGADSAAFFAPDQNILLQHQLANVFEADRNFVQLAIEFRGKLIDQLGHGKRLGNIAGELTRAREVPDEQREDLVWI